MNSFEKKGNILDQLVVRKHVTLKALPYIRNKYNNDNSNIITQQQFDQWINSRRQQKQQLTLYGKIVVHEDLKVYVHLYFIETTRNNTAVRAKKTIRIYSYNINNIPVYATKLKKNHY